MQRVPSQSCASSLLVAATVRCTGYVQVEQQQLHAGGSISAAVWSSCFVWCVVRMASQLIIAWKASHTADTHNVKQLLACRHGLLPLSHSCALDLCADWQHTRPNISFTKHRLFWFHFYAEAATWSCRCAVRHYELLTDARHGDEMPRLWLVVPPPDVV